MPHATVSIQTAGEAFDACVARPTGANAAGLVVIQEIFGVNAVMRDLTDAYATAGYLAVCPDLFWRIEPGIDITDQTPAEWEKAFALFKAFDVDNGVEDIAATIAHVRADPGCSGKVGAVGFCLGGLLAFLTATRTDADAAVSYYGVGLDNVVGEAVKLTRPVLLHIAEEDGFVSKAAQQVILDALKNHPLAEIHTYPGRNHAFARQGGEHYHAADAALAHQRTLAFLQKHLA